MATIEFPGFRLLTIALLMYLAVDLLNPFVPGIFSFADDDYFVEGLTQPLADSGKLAAATSRNDLGGPAETVSLALHVKLTRAHPAPRLMYAHRAVRPRTESGRLHAVDTDASLA